MQDNIAHCKHYCLHSEKDRRCHSMSAFEESLFPFYEFAVKRAGVGIHAVNSEGRTIIYNDKMKEIEGLDLEDIRDLSIMELFNFRQQPSTLMEVLQNGKEQLNIKQTYWNQNETEITTINNSYPIFNDGVLIGAVELSHDVTALEKFVLEPLKKDREPVLLDHIVAESESMKKLSQLQKKRFAQNFLSCLLAKRVLVKT